MVTIATVGYGDLYPVTSYGRFLSSFVIIFGLALFGMMTSFITSRFLHRHNSTKDISEMREELATIKQTLARLEEGLIHNYTANDNISKNKGD